mmetsp:Transcript_18134/g.64509  ORF Transcript_18134/g.64509 Transcript_18134/m.64509 type:complete len:109 (+) Transcript_18134:136-462(+)
MGRSAQGKQNRQLDHQRMQKHQRKDFSAASVILNGAGTTCLVILVILSGMWLGIGRSEIPNLPMAWLFFFAAFLGIRIFSVGDKLPQLYREAMDKYQKDFSNYDKKVA